MRCWHRYLKPSVLSPQSCFSSRARETKWVVRRVVRCCVAQDMENEEAKYEEPENSRVSLTAEVRLGINASILHLGGTFGEALVMP